MARAKTEPVRTPRACRCAQASETKPATELGDANQGAFVDRSSILRASTISNRQVDIHIYLPFYYLSVPRRIELRAGRERKENASVTQSGTRFPNGGSGGKSIPESALRLGCSFRMMPQAETATRNRAVEWDMLSQWQLKRKVHPGIFVRNGMQFPNEWLAESSSRNPRSERDALSRRPPRPPQLQNLRSHHSKTG